MTITAIVAMDRSGLIGDGLKMPWHLPRDLRRFRKHTLGKPIIMGRRTFESLRSPLPDRLNIVLTRDASFRSDGITVAHSIEEALKLAQSFLTQRGGDEVMVIGGGAVFAATVPRWNRLLLTVVEGEFRGDTYFPVDRLRDQHWRLLAREYSDADPKNAHPHWFLDLACQGKAQGPDDFDVQSWLANPTFPLR